MALRRASFFALLVGLLLAVASPALAQAQEATSTAVEASDRHEAFTRLLNQYVDEDGYVDYEGLRAEADEVLVPYLEWLGDTDPSGWSRDERLAFWINAYNAYALKLIVDNYPVENIWATTKGPPEPKEENNPFAMKVGPVADTARTLDEIEHNIIRERFDEPRIHFAVVCAAESCPPLRTEAYTGPNLDDQLDDQGRTFLHDTEKNQVPRGDDAIALNRILKWFMEDFGDSTDELQTYIAQYFEGDVRRHLEAADYKVEFLEYDWTLNDQARFDGTAQASD